MTSQEMWRCRKCGKVTMHQVRKPNHIMHLVLSLLTCGIWLIFWLCACISFGSTHTCLECGAKN